MSTVHGQFAACVVVLMMALGSLCLVLLLSLRDDDGDDTSV